MKRWSKLQKRIYNILDPKLDLQIHCVVYRHDGFCGEEYVPRYFVTLSGEIIFDFPKNYPVSLQQPYEEREKCFWSAVSEISETLAKYLNAGREERMTMTDYWGIIDIIRAADRRVVARQWNKLYESGSMEAKKVIESRKSIRTSLPVSEG